MTPSLLALATVLASLIGAGGISAYLRSKSQNKVDNASADQTIVHTARELIDGVRAEMVILREDTDRKTMQLTREVSYLRGKLEAAEAERDTLRRVENVLRQENAELRSRILQLESRLRDLTDRLATAAQHPTTNINVEDRRT